jgi:hypothetical protein
MLPIQTANLPVEEQPLLHADFLANEKSYLQMRDNLLTSHAGQWVAVHNDRVVAAGSDLMAVTEAAAECSGHPYIARVGEEAQAIFRVRREEHNYDSSYQPFALPRIRVTFHKDVPTPFYHGRQPSKFGLMFSRPARCRNACFKASFIGEAARAV